MRVGGVKFPVVGTALAEAGVARSGEFVGLRNGTMVMVGNTVGFAIASVGGMLVGVALLPKRHTSTTMIIAQVPSSVTALAINSQRTGSGNAETPLLCEGASGHARCGSIAPLRRFSSRA